MLTNWLLSANRLQSLRQVLRIASNLHALVRRRGQTQHLKKIDKLESGFRKNHGDSQLHNSMSLQPSTPTPSASTFCHPCLGKGFTSLGVCAKKNSRYGNTQDMWNVQDLSCLVSENHGDETLTTSGESTHCSGIKVLRFFNKRIGNFIRSLQIITLPQKTYAELIPEKKL